MRMWKIAGLLAVAGLLALSTSHDAMAGKKEKLKAKINGKGFKANVRESIIGTHDGLTNLVILNGTSRKGVRKVTIKNMTVSCVAPLEGATFPNFVGTSQTRGYAISGDELRITNPTASGGRPATVVLKRASQKTM